MQKRWSKAEIAHLERHAADSSPEELARKLQTDVDNVRRKLKELGLTAQGAAAADSAALETYTAALKQMHAGAWQEAAEALRQVMAEADNRHLADRARQSLVACERHMGSASGEGADPYLRAVFEKNSGNLEAAFELCKGHGRENEDERFAYLLASLYSLAGSSDEAFAHLETAIRLEPKNRIHAYHDPDFAELRGQEEFANLVTGASSES